MLIRRDLPEFVVTDRAACRAPLRANALLRRLRLWTVPFLLLVDATAEALGCSGCYYAPWPGAFVTGGDALDVSARGLILLAGDLDGREAANTIAHELRHAWQAERGRLGHATADFDWSADHYADSLQRWAALPSERDAVLWSMRVEPSEHAERLAESAGWLH